MNVSGKPSSHLQLNYQSKKKLRRRQRQLRRRRRRRQRRQQRRWRGVHLPLHALGPCGFETNRWVPSFVSSPLPLLSLSVRRLSLSPTHIISTKLTPPHLSTLSFVPPPNHSSYCSLPRLFSVLSPIVTTAAKPHSHTRTHTILR